MSKSDKSLRPCRMQSSHGLHIDVTTCAARRVLSSERIPQDAVALLKTADMELLIDHEAVDGPYA
jgi:hypothetical protein